MMDIIILHDGLPHIRLLVNIINPVTITLCQPPTVISMRDEYHSVPYVDGLPLRDKQKSYWACLDLVHIMLWEIEP